MTVTNSLLHECCSSRFDFSKNFQKYFQKAFSKILIDLPKRPAIEENCLKSSYTH